MDTMEITKFVGAICGSLLVFLLIKTGAEIIYNTESEDVAYLIEVPEDTAAPAEDAAPEEQVDVAALVADADASAGETIFKRCAACHKVDGNNAVGPHLDGVVGRDIASVDGFSYSDALMSLDGAWNNDEIFNFIANPKEYAPGTKMSFAGLSKPEDRANVIAYLDSLSN